MILHITIKQGVIIILFTLEFGENTFVVLLKIFAKTFNLPLCTMPTINSLRPKAEPFSINASNAGIKDSAPSIENLFVPRTFL